MKVMLTMMAGGVLTLVTFGGGLVFGAIVMDWYEQQKKEAKSSRPYSDYKSFRGTMNSMTEKVEENQ